MQESELEINYQLTTRELGAAALIGLRRSRPLLWALFAMLIAGLVAIAFLFGGTLFGLSAIAGIALGAAIRSNPRFKAGQLARIGHRLIRKNPELQLDRIVRLTDDGIQSQLGETMAPTLQWSAIESISETRGLLLLTYRGSKWPLFIPRRSFPSDSTADGFSQYVMAHIRSELQN